MAKKTAAAPVTKKPSKKTVELSDKMTLAEVLRMFPGKTADDVRVHIVHNSCHNDSWYSLEAFTEE